MFFFVPIDNRLGLAIWTRTYKFVKSGEITSRLGKSLAHIRKNGEVGVEIPAGHARVYQNKGWKGYGDWLGTEGVANQNLDFFTFSEARKFVHSLELIAYNLVQGRTGTRLSGWASNGRIL